MVEHQALAHRGRIFARQVIQAGVGRVGAQGAIVDKRARETAGNVLFVVVDTLRAELLYWIDPWLGKIGVLAGGVGHFVANMAFALLTVVWYWLSSRRERALKFFRAIRRWPVFGAERPRADVDAEPANLPRRPRS